MAEAPPAPSPGRRLLAAVVLCALLGAIAGAAGAWALYRRLGPAERVVAPAAVVPTTTGDTPTYASLAAAAAPSLVAVVIHPVTAADLAGGSARFGTGFVVGGGLVVTSARALAGATTLRLGYPDGEVLDATVAGSDLPHGIAVLRPARQPQKAPPGLAFEDFSQRAPHPGDLVLAVGSRPLAGTSVVAGAVTAAGCGAGTAGASGGGAAQLDALVIDAAAAAPDEGAPLLDGAGRVVGVVSAAAEGQGVVGLDGRAAADLAGALARGDTSPRPTFGAATCTIDAAHAAAVDARAGALLVALTAGGPSDLAGLHAGDVVVAVDGVAVDAGHPYDAAVLGIASGQRVRVTVARDGAERDVAVTAL